MARFHIELRTHSRVWETQDVESEDHTGLRVELARFVGKMLREHAEKIWEDQDWRVDVTDEAGLILFVMRISASNTAATMKLER